MRPRGKRTDSKDVRKTRPDTGAMTASGFWVQDKKKKKKTSGSWDLTLLRIIIQTISMVVTEI